MEIGSLSMIMAQSWKDFHGSQYCMTSRPWIITEHAMAVISKVPNMCRYFCELYHRQHLRPNRRKLLKTLSKWRLDLTSQFECSQSKSSRDVQVWVGLICSLYIFISWKLSFLPFCRFKCSVYLFPRSKVSLYLFLSWIFCIVLGKNSCSGESNVFAIFCSTSDGALIIYLNVVALRVWAMMYWPPMTT